MSSKLKRKRQTQRLMRELQESNDARARTISSLRHTSNNLDAEREANKKLAASNGITSCVSWPATNSLTT